jgi:AraC-like DNA-binding protein
MTYCQYIPQPPLAAFVQCLWYSEGSPGPHAYERLLPNGESSIVIDLREQPVCIYDGQDIAKFDSYAPAIFCGARTDCFVIDTSRQERVIGIQFQPGGAYPFLRMPACEVADTTCELEDIWPGQTGLLREELLGAASPASMFAILERKLVAALKLDVSLPRGLGFAMRRLAAPAANLRVRDVAESLGMSSRRFMELFRTHTGLTPKAFQQVRRFQQVLEALHTGATGRGRHPERNREPDWDRNWASLAAGCGYYDQPHFIHDFRRFSGMTPSEYLANATAHRNHVPIG